MKTDEKYLELFEKCFHLLLRIDSTLFDIYDIFNQCLDILKKHDDEDITFEKMDK